MFTTIMNGFISEVTRRPASAQIRFQGNRRGEHGRLAAAPRRKPRPVAKTARRHDQLPGKYRVLADSFRRAAGFY